jgi:hypothetical protein
MPKRPLSMASQILGDSEREFVENVIQREPTRGSNAARLPRYLVVVAGELGVGGKVIM